MLRLLKIELAKVLPYRTFWIVLLFAGFAILGAAKISNFTINGIQATGGLSSFVWASAYVSQIFLGYLVILLVCNEFENRTLRQHIIDGMSRTEVLLSKFLLQVILILISIAAILGVAVASGLVTETSSLFSGGTLINMGQYILRSLDYLSMALVISLFVRRSGFAVGLFLVWPFFLEPVLGWIAGKYFQGIQEWLPSVVFSHLLKSPLSTGFSMGDVGGGAGGTPIYFAAIGYMVLFWALSYIKLNKSDI